MMNMSDSTWEFYTARVRRVSIALAGIVFLAPIFISAEILPTRGTFEGVYHRDPWGVGRFGYFTVHPDLHAQLSK